MKSEKKAGQPCFLVVTGFDVNVEILEAKYLDYRYTLAPSTGWQTWEEQEHSTKIEPYYGFSLFLL